MVKQSPGRGGTYPPVPWALTGDLACRGGERQPTHARTGAQVSLPQLADRRSKQADGVSRFVGIAGSHDQHRDILASRTGLDVDLEAPQSRPLAPVPTSRAETCELARHILPAGLALTGARQRSSHFATEDSRKRARSDWGDRPPGLASVPVQRRQAWLVVDLLNN